MVTIHTVTIACYFRECRHPTLFRLLCHADIWFNHIQLFFRLYQYTQWVRSTVCVPNPIVGVEWCAFVSMYSSIRSTVVVSIFRDTDHTLVGAIHRGIKDCFIVVATSFYKDVVERFVPYLTPSLCYCIYAVGRDFTFKILCSLRFADKWDTVAYANLFNWFGKC